MPVLADLNSIIGSSHIRPSENGSVVSPADTQEISAVLRACSEQQAVVVPRGGCTKLDWGNPVRADVQLDMSRIAGIREHVWQDMTATVGAGTRWAEMQSALAKHGQQVAVDALFAQRSTVGGTLAVNDSGALRARYGSLRDLVLGITLVLADGTIARSGGKVVKNVAGYDLPKLLVGSFGTLGAITEVTFRLHPLEKYLQSWSISGDPMRLSELMLKIANAGLNAHSLQLRGDATATSLDIRFAEALSSASRRAEQVAAICGSSVPEPVGEHVWSAREELFQGEAATMLKIAALPTSLGPIVAAIRNAAVQARYTAEPAGIATVALTGGATDSAEMIEDLRARLRSTGGIVSVLRWPFIHEVMLDRWGGSPPAIAVLRELKQQFDPLRILNPGRFVGGI